MVMELIVMGLLGMWMDLGLVAELAFYFSEGGIRLLECGTHYWE